MGGSIEQIENWLNSKRDIEAGRTLLSQFAASYAVNAATLSIIQQYTNSGTQRLIAAELTEIKQRILTASRPAPKNLRRVWKDLDYERLTPNLKKLYVQTKAWYQEMDMDRGKSRATPEGDDLRDLMLNVVDLRKKISAAMEKLFYFDKYGVELDPTMAERNVDEQVEKLTSWLRALKANPPYISKNKKSTDDRIKSEVRKRQAELKAINEYLRDAD